MRVDSGSSTVGAAGFERGYHNSGSRGDDSDGRTYSSGQITNNGGDDLLGISTSGTPCSVADLYSGVPKTSPEEEKKEEEEVDSRITQDERSELDDRAYRELVNRNSSPATHLDSFSRGLSATGGPPSNVTSQPVPGYNYCGPGNLDAPPTTPLDQQCKAHDEAYEKANLNHNDVDIFNPGQDNILGDQDITDDELCEFSQNNPEAISPVVNHLFCDPEDYEETSPAIWP
jgi:hypothetical protein